MVIHSTILAWRIPWTEEPGRLQSTGLQRIRQKTSLEASSVHPFVPSLVLGQTEDKSGDSGHCLSQLGDT